MSTGGLRSLATQIRLPFGWVQQDNKKYAKSMPGSVSVLPLTEKRQRTRSQEFDMQNILPEIQSLVGIREALDRIVKGVVDGLGYMGAMLSVVDNKNQTLTAQAIAFNEFIHQLNLPDKVEGVCNIQIIGSSVSLVHDKRNLGVQTCLTGETLIAQNLYDVFQPIIDAGLSHQIQTITDIKTCISIPLLLEGKVVGILCVGTKKDKISEKDLDALHFFVTNAAIAVQNSILFERVNRRLTLREAELNQLREIEKMIHSSLDLPEVLKRILDGAIKLTRAEYGHVTLVGSYASGLVQRVTYPEGCKILNGGARGITQMIMHDKRPKIVDKSGVAELKNNRLTYLTYESHHLHSYSKMKSQMGVPILLGDELIGVIHIAGHKEGAFNKNSLNMLEQLAVQAAIAIRNAHQFKTDREMRERITNLAQVAAMGDMAGNMVHSINNWVGSIRADLNYLKRQQTLGQLNPNELSELLDDMFSNAESTLAMAENIRKPFQALTQEPIDVNECILNMLQAKEGEIENVMVITDLDDLPLVMATQQLELVFENLFNNAVQAMNGRELGILKFATHHSVDGQWVEIVVKDSGSGLPDGLNQKDIFKLGVSGRPDGLGYGLWWCDTFLKRWGGTIQLVENAKAGCRFLIRLPVDTTSVL